MQEFNQFLLNNWILSAAWMVVACALIYVHFRVSAHGPKSITSQMLSHYVNRENAALVDIRGQAEFNKGHIQGAVNIPLTQVSDNIKQLEKHKDKPIIMVCANGIQVAAACNILKKAGFDKLYKLSGGMSSWTADNLPVVK